MKLTKKDITRSHDTSPLHLFRQGIRSEVTLKTYTYTLRKVLCDILEDVLEGDFEQRAGQFVQRARDDPDWTRDLLLSLAWKLRERTELPKDHADYLNPTSVPSHFMSIRKLLDMSGISMPWKRIYATFPEKDNILDTRGWTREEIAAMLVHARDPMDKALVLLLASSGVRVGALDQLNWGDLTPVYREEDGRLTADPGGGGEVACVALSIYSGSPESYTAFATPEAYRALVQYGRTWAEMMGRQPKPGDPVFLATKTLPRRTTGPALAKRVRRMVDKAGLRETDSGSGGGKGKRYETQLMHGFRKFFNKTCREALSGDSLAALIRAEYMMGHRGLVSLDQNYFKTGMLEMAAEYVKVVADLTIDDADRLRLSNRAMAENIQHMENEKDSKITRLEAEAERMRLEVERVRREKDEAVERVREEVAEIRDRGGATADEILSALLKSPKAGGVPGEVAESLTTMMKQLGAAQDTAMRDMNDRHNAAMADMKAEHDAKMERLLRVIGRMAKEGDSGHDPLAEFRGDRV